MKNIYINRKIKNHIQPLLKLVLKSFCNKNLGKDFTNFNNQNDVDKINDIKNFNLKFDKNVNFNEFQSQIEKNIQIISDPILENISSTKLLDKLKEQGIDKTQEEVEFISKIAADRGTNSEPLRYMALDDFADKYRKKIGDQKMKFMMPIGWGWAFPLVKYSAMVILAAKVATGVPWLPFFMLCGLTIRLLLLPFVIRQMVLIQRMAKVSPNIRLLVFCTMKSDLSFSKKAYYFVRSVWKYSKDAKVNPLAFAAYNILQMPVFFLLVMSIRKICYEEDLKGTGILWFKNLNEADPYMILPLFSVGLTYYNLGRGINKDNEHWVLNRWRSFFQILQICYLPFTCNWPAVNKSFKFRVHMFIGLLLLFLLIFSKIYLDILKLCQRLIRVSMRICKESSKQKETKKTHRGILRNSKNVRTQF